MICEINLHTVVPWLVLSGESHRQDFLGIQRPVQFNTRGLHFHVPISTAYTPAQELASCTGSYFVTSFIISSRFCRFQGPFIIHRIIFPVSGNNAVCLSFILWPNLLVIVWEWGASLQCGMGLESTNPRSWGEDTLSSMTKVWRWGFPWSREEYALSPLSKAWRWGFPWSGEECILCSMTKAWRWGFPWTREENTLSPMTKVWRWGFYECPLSDLEISLVEKSIFFAKIFYKLFMAFFDKWFFFLHFVMIICFCVILLRG